MKRLLANALFFLTSVLFLNVGIAEAATGGVTIATPIPFTYPATTAGIGASVDQAFTLQKTGGAPIDGFTINSVNFTAATSHFSIVGDTCTGNTLFGGTCTVTVRFNPTTAGTQSATVSVNAGAGDTTFTFGVSGLGLPDATVQFSQPVYSINEAGAPTATLTVTRTGTDTSSSFTAAYTLTPIAPATGADIGVVTPASPLSFASGVTSVAVNVPIIDDSLVEPTETFQATLGAIVAGTGTPPVLGTQSTALLAIADNESTATSVIELSASNYAIGESAGTVHVIAIRSGNTATVVSATIASSDDTAIAGSDYTAIPALSSVSFAAGEIAKSFDVAVTPDAAVEGNETFNVTLSAPVGAVLGSQQSSSVTIVDDDTAAVLPTIEFLSSNYSVSESGGSVTLTAVRSGDPSGAVSVDYATSDGSAVDPTDYTAIAATALNFAANEVVKTFTVTINDDTTQEPSEFFDVSLSNPVGAALGPKTFSQVDIIDDDGPTSFEIEQPAYFFGESSVSNVVKIVRSGDSGGIDTVTIGSTNGSATFGTDHTTTPNLDPAGPNTALLTFNPGETIKTILVNPIADATVDGDLAFTLNLSLPSAPATLGTIADSTVTILDDEGVATIQFAQASEIVSEAPGIGTALITRSGDPTGTVSVDVIPVDVSAVNGSDYLFGSPTTVTFNPGQTMQFVTFLLNPDGVVEPTETFLLTFDETSISGNAVLGPTSISEVSILDSDGTSAVLQFSQPTYTFSEGGISGIVTVTRSGNTTSSVSADFFQTDLTATGGGTDYTVTNGTLTFNPGEITKTIQVDLNDDALVESTETFRLTLDDASLTGGAVLGANAIADVSIIDNEGQATIQFGQANYIVSEGIGTFTAIVTRSGDTSTAVDVDVIPVNVTAIDLGTDYALANPTAVHFNAGETTQTVSISINDDSTIEQTESFLLTFDASSLTSSAVLGAVSTSQVDIVDNDGNATVEFKQGGYSFGEGIGTGVLFAIRSGDASQLVTVPVTLTDVTATGGGTDYDTITTSVTFNTGESVKPVLVEIDEDTDIEPTESFLAEIGAPTAGSAILGTNSLAQVDILDNDGSATFNIEKSDYVIGEGGVNLAVIVTRSGSTAVSQDVDVNTNDVSATAGSDYTDISTTTLTFGVGVTTQTVLVPITEDTDVEDSETFTVELANPTNGALLGIQSTALATIIDNDGDATIEFNPANYVFSEGLGVVTLKVIRSGDASSAVTVPFAVAPVSAATPADFSVTTVSPLVFGVGVTSQTITVTLADDVLIEPTESFVVTLAPPTTGSAVLGVDSTAEVQIVDNDGDATIEFSKPTYNFDEGAGTVTVLAIRSGDSSGTVGASFAAVDVSATGADYAVTTGSPLSFGPFVTALPITITLTDDTEVETTETFNLLLSAPTGGAVLGANSAASVAIDDNDNAGILAFSSDAFAFNENIGTAAITVTRTGGSDGAVSVNCSTINGTATAPTDFTALSGNTLDWADGDTAPKTCNVTIVNDILEESLESFTITLSDATGDAVVGSNNVATIDIVDNDEPGEIAFSDDTYEVEEGGGSITVTVLRKTGTTGIVTANYETVPGTAVSPDDFTSSSGTLTWNDGDNTPRVISIPIADTDTATLKVFSVVLSSPTGGATLADPSVAEVHIGFGAPTVPNKTDGGGCSLTAGNTPTSSAPVALMVIAALALAFFRSKTGQVRNALRAGALLGLSTVFLMAGGSTGCNKRPPVPAEAIQALERLVSEAQGFATSFSDVESCDGFEKAVANLNADQVIPCDTGDTQVQALVSECNDGPFSGTGTLVAVAQNCVDESDGTTLDGTVTYTIHTDGTNDVTFSSAGATVNGIKYPVGGVTVTTSGGTTTCEGVLTVLELPCTVTPDCSTCEFLQ